VNHAPAAASSRRRHDRHRRQLCAPVSSPDPVEMIDYGVTKTAVLALSRGLAKRMAGTNVTVNAVLPGPTLSEGVADMLKGKQGRNGRPIEEVAAQFVRLARPSSIIRRTTAVGRSQTLSSTSLRSKGRWRHSGHNHMTSATNAVRVYPGSSRLFRSRTLPHECVDQMGEVS
jgi:NAD(P)-dependent dehydrogenase (short-subunit alcohol dehydrogenase family)